MLLAAVLFSPLAAQEPASEPEAVAVLDESAACECCRESIWNRPTLTGDWFGHRSCLQESGITFAGRSTHSR
jgi:hypothetical protein